ncbi:acetyltransferase [Salimicrobium sp. PL1-032A]|uniref:acetyltransferase n=1 Tax=Salimicrobium sp. PL1-032A TaxID=3095364 RepID=UPI00326192AD
MELIALIGCGGHGKVIEHMAEKTFSEVKIVAKLDDVFTERYVEDEILYGPVNEIFRLLPYGVKIIVTIGDNRTRQRVVERLGLYEGDYTNMIHSRSIVSDDVEIGKGNVIMPGVIINPGVKIGNHCIMNSGSIVEHDSQVNDFSHICPGTVMTGNVSLGEGVILGANSTILPGLEIGKWSTIGAGSTVIHNMKEYITAVGSPAMEVENCKKYSYPPLI